MYIPSQERWRKVIDNFYCVLPFALQEQSLDMLEFRVNTGAHECGTVHCVGGWYAIAVYQETAFRGRGLTYEKGANRLALDLGFNHQYYIREWALNSPELWGNPHGFDMFSHAKAYDHGNGPAKTLADVIHHFEFVADRCRKFEKQLKRIAV